MGTGLRAVGYAGEILDADEHYSAVILPDSAIVPNVVMSEMIRVRQEHSGSVPLAAEMELSPVSIYGVSDVEATEDDWVKKVVGIVGKPAVEDASSNVVATWRSLLDRAILSTLYRITPGKGR